MDKACSFEIKHIRSGKCFSFALEVQRDVWEGQHLFLQKMDWTYINL